MIKSELVNLIKDTADDADIDEIILKNGFAKPFNAAEATVDDYKSMLANNAVVKAYYQSDFDRAVSTAVDNHDKKFMKEKFPSLLEEEVKKRIHKDETPEQKEIRELKEWKAQAEKEKAERIRLDENAAKLKDKGLDTGLAKYIQNDSDIEYFNNLIYSNKEQFLKANAPKPENGEGKEKDIDDVTRAFLARNPDISINDIR